MQRRTVVLVENDPGMEEMVQTIIEQLDGARVEMAEDVGRAGELARTLVPALVIVDDDSPADGGSETIQELRADAVTRHIPVVVLCSDGDRGRDLVARGAEAFLPKPFDVNHLLALVQFYTQVVPSEYSGR